MANLYADKTEKYNKQLAGAYIAYMMVGSMFNKCVCHQPGLINRARLHYCEMGKDQVNAEDAILGLLDSIDEAFADRLAKLRCEAVFKETVNSGHTTLDVMFDTGGFETLEATVDEKGKIRLWRHEGGAA